jgi:transposase
MRPVGTTAQLAARREGALELLRQGNSVAAVASALGVAARSVQRWQQAASSRKRKAKRPRRKPGRPSRLTAVQRRRLEMALRRGAYGYGYSEDYWTLDRIAHLIWELFSVRYHPSAVWHILKRLGWSCQKPQRVALQRNDQAIHHWKRYLWPHIKKVARVARNPDSCG